MLGMQFSGGDAPCPPRTLQSQVSAPLLPQRGCPPRTIPYSAAPPLQRELVSLSEMTKGSDEVSSASASASLAAASATIQALQQQSAVVAAAVKMAPKAAAAPPQSKAPERSQEASQSGSGGAHAVRTLVSDGTSTSTAGLVLSSSSQVVKPALSRKEQQQVQVRVPPDDQEEECAETPQMPTRTMLSSKSAVSGRSDEDNTLVAPREWPREKRHVAVHAALECLLDEVRRQETERIYESDWSGTNQEAWCRVGRVLRRLRHQLGHDGSDDGDGAALPARSVASCVSGTGLGFGTSPVTPTRPTVTTSIISSGGLDRASQVGLDSMTEVKDVRQEPRHSHDSNEMPTTPRSGPVARNLSGNINPCYIPEPECCSPSRSECSPRKTPWRKILKEIGSVSMFEALLNDLKATQGPEGDDETTETDMARAVGAESWKRLRKELGVAGAVDALMREVRGQQIEQLKSSSNNSPPAFSPRSFKSSQEDTPLQSARKSVGLAPLSDSAVSSGDESEAVTSPGAALAAAAAAASASRAYGELS